MFKPFTQLVPRGLVKTFTHGYAQSVVAASQTSLAGTINPIHNRNDTINTRYGLPQYKGQSIISPPIPAKSSQSLTHDSLTSYFASWQAQQKPAHLRTASHQTQRLLESSSADAEVESKSQQQSRVEAAPDASVATDALPIPRSTRTSRAYSTTAIDGIQKLEDDLRTDFVTTQAAVSLPTQPQLSSSIDQFSWLDLASIVQSSEQPEVGKSTHSHQQRSLEHVALLESLCQFWASESANIKDNAQMLESLVQVLFRDGVILQTSSELAQVSLSPAQLLMYPMHQRLFLVEVVDAWVSSSIAVNQSDIRGLRAFLDSNVSEDEGLIAKIRQASQVALQQLQVREANQLPHQATTVATPSSVSASPREPSQPASQLSLETQVTTPQSHATAPYPRPFAEPSPAEKLNDLLDKGIAAGSAEALKQAMEMMPMLPQTSGTTYGVLFKKAIHLAGTLRRVDLAARAFGLAKSMLPYGAQSRSSWVAWNGILDAMVAASLNGGDQMAAQQYHQQLNQMLSSPSANTHGLYITSLSKKDHISDEASFALDVFNRAVSEGVAPTAFLYNAVVAKLAKARRIEDCRSFLVQMETRGIHPTSITYGTIISAFARVANETEALKYFERMEEAPDYRALPAPFNQMMQFYVQSIPHLSKSKALSFFASMKRQGVQPTLHTYNLLIQAHATLEPRDLNAAKAVFGEMISAGLQPESQHYASLITELGRAQRNLDAARGIFDEAMSSPKFKPDSVLYQALLESMGHNGQVQGADALLTDMRIRRVPLTGYITNALIHGYASAGQLPKAMEAFYQLAPTERKPSTYETMIKVCRATDPIEARNVLEQMRRHQPSFPFKVVRSAEQLLR